ncbi:MAG TPA: hypothetical protein VKU85_02130 [bacterium]|nr:hypothetical protein [bacterium]
MGINRAIALGACAAACLALAACSDNAAPNNALDPFQPEIVNTAASFELQATAVTNVTTTQDYTWQNAGTTANVNQATVVNDGAATLAVLDADGTEVYSSDLAVSGSFVTAAGTAGDWTLRLVLNGCFGDLNFRVETP